MYIVLGLLIGSQKDQAPILRTLTVQFKMYRELAEKTFYNIDTILGESDETFFCQNSRRHLRKSFIRLR